MLKAVYTELRGFWPGHLSGLPYDDPVHCDQYRQRLECRTVTKAVTLGLFALIVVVDVVLIATGRDSISRFMYDFSRDYPIVAFGLGCVVGHWFWPVGAKSFVVEKFNRFFPGRG